MKNGKGNFGKIMGIVRAFSLVVVLISPILIQGLHIHKPSGCCHLPHRDGINLPAHPHHSAKNCLIYSFIYTLVLSPKGVSIPPPLTTNYKEYLPAVQQKTADEPTNASQRAPPVLAV